MISQGDTAGIAGRIASFVVKPHGKTGLLYLVDGADEGEPLSVAFEVLIEGGVANYASEALGTEPIDVIILRCGLIGPVMNDFQDASIGRWSAETVLPATKSGLAGKK